MFHLRARGARRARVCAAPIGDPHEKRERENPAASVTTGGGTGKAVRTVPDRVVRKRRKWASAGR